MSYLVLKTDLGQHQRNYLKKIQSASQHLLGIINDILDDSKIEAGKLNLEQVEFSFQQLLDNVTTLIADKAALDEGIAILEKAAVSFESSKAAESAPWPRQDTSSTSIRSIPRRFARSSIRARR